MNYRPSAQLAEMHRDARCPESCPLCAQIDAADVEPQTETYWPVEGNYPEGWREP